MPRPVVVGAIDALAEMVQNWVPAPADRTRGSNPVPGLELEVRKVLGGSSLAAAGELARVSIPGVPGVISKPAVSDDGYVEKVRAWRDQVRAADAATSRARAEAKEGAAAIRGADWSSGRSEIAGCPEALALTTTGPRRVWVLVSDLRQNEPPQVGLGDLTDARILIVQVCVEAQGCLDQQHQWSRALSDRGAARVAYARPEQLHSALSSWFRGQGS